MFSYFNLNKYRALVVALLLFVLIALSVLLFTAFISAQLEADASRIEQASAQHSFIHRLSQSISILKQEKRDNLPLNSLIELKKTISQFENNLNQLKTDGVEYEFFSLLGIDTNAIRRSALATESIWDKYKAQLLSLTAGAAEAIDENIVNGAITDSKIFTPRLLDASSKTVAQARQIHEIKSQSVFLMQSLAFILFLANVIYILFKFLRQLSISDRKIDISQRETSNILNTVDEGLMLLDSKGKTGSQMSKAVHNLFGRKIEPGEDFREILSELVSAERAEEIKIYINLLFDPKVKPALLVQLDPMKEVEVTSSKTGKVRFLSFKLRQLQQKGVISGLLVTVLDITDKVYLTKELASVQSEAHLDLEDLLRVFEQDPATMNEFLTVSRRKLSHLNEAMRTVSKNPSAYKSLIKSTSVVIHGIKGESTALRLLGVSRQAHTMENAMAGLLDRPELRGEDLIPVAYELSKVQEQVARIQRLFKRITGASAAGGAAVANKSIFEPTRLFEEPSPASPSSPSPDAHSRFLATVFPNKADSAPALTQNDDALSFPKLKAEAIQAESIKPAGPPLFSLAPSKPASIASRGSSSSDIVLSQPLSDLTPLTMLFEPSVPPLDEMAENLKKLSSTVALATGKSVLMSHEIEPITLSGPNLRVLREILPQLVRNSVVHGLESPNERLIAGKAIQGELKLTLRKLSDSIIEVSVKDDGRGITLDAVKARLHAMKVNTEGMSSGQIMQHIFNLQFSTSDVVTEHAGRGVGLALVKESLEKAGGKLKVNTRPGQSTEFLIHLENQL